VGLKGFVITVLIFLAAFFPIVLIFLAPLVHSSLIAKRSCR
jgi:hypothetical protein